MLDVDGVLVGGRPDDGRELFATLEADLGLSPALLRAAFFEPHWQAIVTGKEPLAPRLASVLGRIAPQFAADTLIDYWLAHDSRIDAAVLAAVDALRLDGIPVWLTTNQEHLRARYLMETMGLGAHVDGIAYSAALGFRKPAPEFYRLAAERSGAAPAEIIFVDDTLPNVEAAERAGWHALHWRKGCDLLAMIETARDRR